MVLLGNELLVKAESRSIQGMLLEVPPFCKYATFVSFQKEIIIAALCDNFLHAFNERRLTNN